MTRRQLLTSLGLAAVPTFAKKLKPYSEYQINPEYYKKVTISPKPDSRNFICIVGDFEETSNGHIYTRETWEKMFGDIGTGRGPFIAFNDTRTQPVAYFNEMLSLKDIVGSITKYHFVPLTDRTIVLVEFRVLDTQIGNALNAVHMPLLPHAAPNQFFCRPVTPMYLTPTGIGNVTPTHFVENYTLSRFVISPNESAFRSATPIRRSLSEALEACRTRLS